MDLSEYRNSPKEQKRIEDILNLLPETGENVLEIGARDGYITKILADRFNKVVALDLTKPNLNIERVQCIDGDLTSLQFSDNSFECVLCSEVLEHIPSNLLAKACDELTRVTQSQLIVGVPFDQDNRLGRTTCIHCGWKNPPFGHVNTFDERKLKNLFPDFKVERTSLVGKEYWNDVSTNIISTYLMDIAGNPYGTYFQEEKCINCGEELVAPKARNIFQKVCSKFSIILTKIQNMPNKLRSKPLWIHMKFKPISE